MHELNSATGIISLGQTGFRVGSPLDEYKEILISLREFRNKGTKGWSIEDQISFAKFHNDRVKDKQDKSRLLKKDKATGVDKGSRLKTSFMVDLGFADDQRHLTDPGKAYLEYADKTSSLNEWGLTNLNMLCLTQFLKYQWNRGKTELKKPILSLIYCCLEFDNELPYDFLKYFWTRSVSKEELDKNIKIYKDSNCNLEQAFYTSIRDKYLNSEVYKNFSENLSSIKSKDICDSEKLKHYFTQKYIVPHGKGLEYLLPTYDFFLKLLNYWEDIKNKNLDCKKQYVWDEIKNKKKAIKSSLETETFHKQLFGKKLTQSINSIGKEEIIFFENTNLMKSADRSIFLKEFHILYQVLTTHTNCNEYDDQNFRNLKMMNILMIDYKTVKLRVLFKYFFERVKNKILDESNFLPDESQEYKENLQSRNKCLSEISPLFEEDLEALIERVKIEEPKVKEFGIEKYEQNMRMDKLKNLISEVWSKKNLISLLEQLNSSKDAESRDRKIRQEIKKLTNNEVVASGPAILEYLISICFYQISNERIELERLVESLDENGLPTYHEQGGVPDIKFDYKSRSYICEVTLQNDDGQRKMEAEPVPRHLATHIFNDKNNDAICFFIAPKLDPNNLVVLRAYKKMPWYGANDNVVSSMNIFPLELKDLINCLKKEDSFESILEKVELLIESEETDGYKWYKNEIEPAFK